ncbi:hypothetical protein NB636_08155 [Oxalobacter aliiformigenes]|uniref:hypothetical protein n=1 Tax=Oxalobacter aliiformigenes TaxID=2946593 RepID=UPI0022AED819|nr:hypothetical protein [Oxalobacter aliiformigenes]MCZ4065927.1 hypothetical protein [Oxalobacter aliiformigenes]WAV98680.1 hypothetical protein NB636_08155 [Oxalobacter aliiformigenes]
MIKQKKIFEKLNELTLHVYMEISGMDDTNDNEKSAAFIHVATNLLGFGIVGFPEEHKLKMLGISLTNAQIKAASIEKNLKN